MSKKRTITTLIIILIAFIVVNVFLISLILWNHSRIKKKIVIYHNIDVYTSGSYDGLVQKHEHFANSAELYFPKYEEFPFSSNVSDFCVFNGAKTYIYDLTYTIELNFETRESFDEFISYEYDRFSYIEVYSYKDYSVFLVNDDTINFYYYKESVPYIGGLLCINEEELTVRYMVYELLGGKPRYNVVFKSTDLEW